MPGGASPNTGGSAQPPANHPHVLADVLACLLSAGAPERIVAGLFATLAPMLNLDVCLSCFSATDERCIHWHPGGSLPADLTARIRALDFGDPETAEDIAASAVAIQSQIRSAGIEACACHPLINSKGAFGFLAFGSRARSGFDESESELLRLVSNHAAIAFERLRSDRELRQSEKRYRSAFEDAGVAICDEDFSAIKAAIDALAARGIADPAGYIAEHPEFVREAVRLVRVRDVNPAALRLFRARSKQDLLQSLDQIFAPESFEAFAGELVAIAEGKTLFETETVQRTLTGERIDVLLAIVFPEPGQPFDRVLVTLTDITGRKHAERDLLERARQQQALYELADQLHRSRSVETTYRAAMDAITAALACDRASISLFAPSGALRSVAWKGISDDYRRVAEGYLPWTPDTSRPEPISIPDAREAPLEPGLRAALETEGIRSVAFIPLVANGRLIGKFVVYHSQPGRFSPADLDIGLTVARQLAFGIERRRAERALRESEERLRLLADAMPALVGRLDENLIYRFVNRAYSEWFGLEQDDVIGRHMREILGDDTFALIQDKVERARSGERVDYEATLPHKYGGHRYVLATHLPDRDPAGRVRGIYVMVHDITSRRQAEEKLAASEREYRAMFELAAAGKVQCDPATGRFTRVNHKFCEITGYTQSELLNLTFDQITHPDDIAVDAQSVQAAFRGEAGGWQSEKRYIRKDGGIVWALVVGALIRDDSGRPIRTIATVQDVTERQRALMEIEFQKYALDQASIVAITDRAGTITYVNDKFSEISGYSASELIGQNHRILNSGLHSREFFRSMYRTIARGKVWRGEIRNRRKDGSFYWVDTTIVPYLGADGRPERYVAIRNDITERKLVEAALRDSEERFRNMADHCPVMLRTTGPTGRCIYINRRWCEFTGQPPESALEFGWLEAIHPDDRETANLAFVTATETHALFSIEYRLRRHDGQYRWAIDAAAPRFGPAAEFLGFIGSMVDIDDQKRTAENLERAVDERTAELLAINEQLETFVYSIAHDLRAPLRSIAGYSQLLLDDFADSLDAGGQQMLRRIEGSSAFMDRLLLDLLAYGRTARAEVDLGPVHVSKAWETALFQCATQLEQTGGTIETAGPPVTVRAHEATLGQCLANLLSNALKFVGPGVRPRVLFRAEDLGETARLWVEDNGIGIPAGQQERVFRVFERLQGARYPGTGIGLSIVRKGVERMGGNCGLESAPGEGTRFWIELPKFF